MDVNALTGVVLSLITIWLLKLEMLRPRHPTSTVSAAGETIASSPSPSPPAIPASRETPSPTVQYALKVEEATWCVAGLNPGKRQPHCASGFAIDPMLVDRRASDGVFVVTNYHVIANTGPRPLVSYQGKAKADGNWTYGEVFRADPERDLAIVRIPDAGSPIARLADTAPTQPGLPIKAVGFPNDQPLTIKDSQFIGMQRNCLAVVPCIGMAQQTITHGNSGGPLAAREADLMGSGSSEQEVVIGVNEGETTVEQAISVTVLKEFLDDSSSTTGL